MMRASMLVLSCFALFGCSSGSSGGGTSTTGDGGPPAASTSGAQPEAKGQAPTLADLKLPATMTVGQDAKGSAVVSDPDGLAGLKFEITLSGPAESTFEAAVQGATKSTKKATVPIVLQVSAAPAGTYTVKVVAIDGDGNRSNELSGETEVQP